MGRRVRKPQQAEKARPGLRTGVALAALLAAAAVRADACARLPAVLEAFNAAFVAADVERLAGLLDEDYLHTNAGGTPIGKQAWLDWIAARRAELDAGRLRIDTYRVVDLQINCRGDAAAVVGRVRSSGLRDGAAFDVDVRVTQLWRAAGEDWRRVAFQDAPAR